MRIQVELGFILQAGTCQILNFAQNPRQSQSVQGTELNWGGTPHRKSVYREVGTPHIFSEQGANRGGGTPHILFEQGANRRGGHRTSKQAPVQITSSVDGWVGRLRRLCAGGVAGPVIIVPLRGSILQAETCQILRLAENPRWSPSVAKSESFSSCSLCRWWWRFHSIQSRCRSTTRSFSKPFDCSYNGRTVGIREGFVKRKQLVESPPPFPPRWKKLKQQNKLRLKLCQAQVQLNLRF